MSREVWPPGTSGDGYCPKDGRTTIYLPPCGLGCCRFFCGECHGGAMPLDEAITEGYVDA